MNLFKYTLVVVVLGGFLSSCDLLEIDNFDGPNATLMGSIIDADTGELVLQDIVRGTQIQIFEDGWDPVSPQNLEIKTDGTYHDSRLFSNTYTVIPISTNFHAVDTLFGFDISGSTTLDFTVTPYIRVKDVTMELIGDIVTANFRIEQTIDSIAVNDSTNAPVFVRKVGLYGHRDPNVGEPMQLGKEEENVNAIMVRDVNDTFTLEFDTSRDADFVGDNINLVYFRIGAILDMPDARYNYAPTVEFDLD
ncbi:MAG: DUF3823 domain-containing protein [Reichenbachiella sp.]